MTQWQRAARLGRRYDDDRNIVYMLDEGEQVGCYFCIQNRDHRSYGRGEAFLASAGHTPWDGNANYVCWAHLDDDALVISSDARMELAAGPCVSRPETMPALPSSGTGSVRSG